jgi:hypothetical protein
MSLSLAWPASWLHLVYAMQKNKKKKRKRSKDSGSWPGYHHLDITTWISSLGYHHLDIITWISSLMKWQPQFRPTYLRIASQQGYLLHIAYSTRPDQTRPVQIKKYIYKRIKKIKKNKKK